MFQGTHLEKSTSLGTSEAKIFFFFPQCAFLSFTEQSAHFLSGV